MNTAIITAAGSGERASLGINKNLFVFEKSTVIEKTVSAFLKVNEIDEIVVTASKADFDEFKKLLLPLSSKIKVITGDKTRTLSIKKALDSVNEGYVLIHDGARPFVTEELIKKCLYKAINEGNCIPVVPLTDTVAVAENGKILTTERVGLYGVQTPQVFKAEEIKKAYALIKETDCFTDDCGVYTKYIAPCFYVDGDKNNVKLTYKEDFENLLPKRTGIGFDLHKLVIDRKLILGGVQIPHDKGLLGHSDADVVIHALMDAMLSACSLKDIGHYFPDTDEKYKDISSVILLQETLEIIKKQGYKPVNATIVIMAEKPKLSPFVEKIKDNLAVLLNVKTTDIGISCTTLEGIGSVGREEAIATYASVTLEASL